jgi:hypothetical protein
MKASLFVIFDKAEEWEIPLSLLTGEAYPKGGILQADDDKHVAAFSSRKSALQAIGRTSRYVRAFPEKDGMHPLPAFCKIRTLEIIPEPAS